jgi:hypothetical protein
MPCSDITEYVEIELTCAPENGAERLASFALSKNTCGAPIGDASVEGRGLLAWTAGRDVESLRRCTLQELVGDERLRFKDEFMLVKQLAALQAALDVYVGAEAGGIGQLFVLERLDYGPQSVALSGLVRIDAAVERIRACSNCCTTTKKAKTPALPS